MQYGIMHLRGNIVHFIRLLIRHFDTASSVADSDPISLDTGVNSAFLLIFFEISIDIDIFYSIVIIVNNMSTLTYCIDKEPKRSL